MQALLIGIKGTVLPLNQATGAEIWRTELGGSQFVNVTLHGDQVLAATRGEIYSLDRSTHIEPSSKDMGRIEVRSRCHGRAANADRAATGQGPAGASAHR
jgi:hypothetical protein